MCSPLCSIRARAHRAARSHAPTPPHPPAARPTPTCQTRALPHHGSGHKTGPRTVPPLAAFAKHRLLWPSRAAHGGLRPRRALSGTRAAQAWCGTAGAGSSSRTAGRRSRPRRTRPSRHGPYVCAARAARAATTCAGLRGAARRGSAQCPPRGLRRGTRRRFGLVRVCCSAIGGPTWLVPIKPHLGTGRSIRAPGCHRAREPAALLKRFIGRPCRVVGRRWGAWGVCGGLHGDR